MKKLLIGAAVFALVTPAVAQVASPPVPQPRPMAAKVHSRAEVQAKVAEHFARLDTNRDGFVTKAEADSVRQARRAQFADRAKDRVGQNRARAFERLDTNRDGAISRGEWDARAAQRQQRMAMRRDRDGDGRPDARRGGMRGMHGFGAFSGRMFDMADANRDGRVTLPEAQTAALRHFDTVDVNRDGQITPDERMQMRQRMRAQRRG